MPTDEWHIDLDDSPHVTGGDLVELRRVVAYLLDHGDNVNGHQLFERAVLEYIGDDELQKLYDGNAFWYE